MRLKVRFEDGSISEFTIFRQEKFLISGVPKIINYSSFYDAQRRDLINGQSIPNFFGTGKTAVECIERSMEVAIFDNTIEEMDYGLPETGTIFIRPSGCKKTIEISVGKRSVTVFTRNGFIPKFIDEGCVFISNE